MAKTSQIVPQKEKASSSQCVADGHWWNHGQRSLGKDAVLRPLSNEEDVSTFVPKPVKENKKKRASLSEYPKPKKRTARKPNKNVIPLTVESVLHLRDEEEEEEYNESTLAFRTKRATDASMPARSMMPYGASSRTENIPESGSGRAVVVHREQCSHSQNELHRYTADLKRAIDERNFLKLSLGQREEEIKDLRAELSKAYRDQNDLSEQVMMLLKTYGFDTGTVCNISVSQLQQKIGTIGRLREEVDVIRMESMQWKEGMDRFAAEKETDRAQLSSSETQLQKVKEKNLVQAKKIEELEARLASVLAKAESDAEKAKTYADALVAIYKADAEVAQVQAREAAESADGRAHWVAELAKYRSRRETLEEIHARGFDLTEEIKMAKELEADAEALVSDDDDDDDGSKSGSENGGESDKEKTAPV
ncbi:MAR-binding filament-like protein 1-1 [Nicotiana tomentosiformis]|uniref:MAR-binding filament-like protein 1-1 n=1 Tax=Nicotiana tomentosiformis TaxID=4098 RepID=UPI00388CB39F